MQNKLKNKRSYLLGGEAAKWVASVIARVLPKQSEFRLLRHRVLRLAMTIILLFFIVPLSAFAAISASDKVSSGGLDSGLVGYWTMDSKDINWTANTMKDRSGQVGTVYYKTVTVSGTLSPDVTGTYTTAGMFDGVPYYQSNTTHDNGSGTQVPWYIALATDNTWLISKTIGSSGGSNKWNATTLNIFATTYPAGNGSTGTATVANNTGSGTYYIAPIPATLVGMSTTTSPAFGKIGQALRFNGSTSYLDTGNGDILKNLTTNISASAWIYLNSIPSGTNRAILDKGTNGYLFGISVNDSSCAASASGKVIFGNSGVNIYNCSSVILKAKKWYFVTAVMDTSTSAKIYVNGVDVTAAGNGSTALASTATNLLIGKRTGSATYLDGLVDDVRIYNRALSAGEIQKLYGQGAEKINYSAPIKATTTSPAAGLNYGLVGYWTMDPKDINWTTNKIVDKSGNGNTGTLYSLDKVASPALGRIGQALKFDSNRRISINHQSYFTQAPFTASVWLKINTPASVVNQESTLLFKSNSSGPNWTAWSVFLLSPAWGASLVDKLAFRVYDSGATPQVIYSNSKLATGVWYHITVSLDASYNMKMYINGVQQISTYNVGSINSTDSTLFMGSTQANSSVFGELDDVRFYNRTLSAAEIAKLYAQGGDKINVSQQPKTATSSATATGLAKGLVGYWTMDAKDINWKANTMVDRSGNGNIFYNTVTVSGTLSPDVTGPYTANGMYNGLPCYQRGSDSWYIWWHASGARWVISASKGSFVGAWWTQYTTSPASLYGEQAPATGPATVANNTSSGVYYLVPIPATLVGMSTSTSPAFGKIGQSLKFNGSSSCINAGTANSLNITGPVTVSAWIYPKTSQQGDIFVQSRDAGTANTQYFLSYSYSTDSYKITFMISDGSALPKVTSQTLLSLNKWYYVTGVWDGTTNAGSMKVYVNGVLSGSVQSTVSAIRGISTAAFIGCDTNRYYFPGFLDDVRIYNRALSAAEIGQLYNQGR